MTSWLHAATANVLLECLDNYKTQIPSSTSMRMAYLYERNRVYGHHRLSRREWEWIHPWKYSRKVPRFSKRCSACWAEVLLAPNAMSRDMKLFHFSFWHKWDKETFWAMQHQRLSSLYLNNEWLNVERYQLLLMRMCVSPLSSSQGVKKLKESKILKIGLEMCLQDLRYDINSRGRNARWGGRHHREKLQDG